MTPLERFLYVLRRDHPGVSLTQALDLATTAGGHDGLEGEARSLARRLQPEPRPTRAPDHHDD